MKSMNMMKNFTISYIECLLTPCWDKVWQTQGARRKKQSKAGGRSIDKKKPIRKQQQETFSHKYFTRAPSALNINNNMNEAMQNSVKTLQTEPLFWESLVYWCSGSFTFLHFQRKEEESTRQNKC